MYDDDLGCVQLYIFALFALRSLELFSIFRIPMT